MGNFSYVIFFSIILNFFHLWVIIKRKKNLEKVFSWKAKFF